MNGERGNLRVGRTAVAAVLSLTVLALVGAPSKAGASCVYGASNVVCTTTGPAGKTVCTQWKNERTCQFYPSHVTVKRCRSLGWHRGVGYSFQITSSGVGCGAADRVILHYDSLHPQTIRGFRCTSSPTTQNRVYESCVRGSRWIHWLSDSG